MKRAACLLVVCLSPSALEGQQIYGNDPDWRSSDRHYATGGAFFDVDQDGWPEFVVSNGNDILREKVGVYKNNAGTLANSPGWQSSDVRYHGHLTTGDIDQDGYEEVVVAVLIAEGGSGVKYYHNNAGTLTSSPAWESANSFYGWHCSLGDPDQDGDLDLLIGSSDAYGSGRWKNFIYFNNDGSLETSPSWRTDDRNNLDHMEFCDVDGDGDLDVVAIGSGTANFIYRNNDGQVAKAPDWNSTDNFNQFANTLAVGDCTGDGRPDLIMSDNNQLNGGSGRFKLYAGRKSGSFQKTYGWSYFDGYVSAVALADLDNDGDLDLATGAWWDKTRIFLNTGSGFAGTPSWNSNPTIVVEAICFGDVNRDGNVDTQEYKDVYTGETRRGGPGPMFLRGMIPGARPRKLYYLDHRPVESVLRVVVDGRELSLTEYCLNRINGWISLGERPRREVRIDYRHSTRLDMGVTDWENNGNLLYLHK